MREVLDSLYSNTEQETEEAPAETGRGEESLSAKLRFVRLVETLIRMINTLSLTNKVDFCKEIKNIFTFLKDKDILELISEGIRESKEGEGLEVDEPNGKSDEPIEEEIGKEIPDNLETSKESLIENLSNSTEL